MSGPARNPATTAPAPGSHVEIRPGLELLAERAAWPDGTPMMTVFYRTRGPDGRWTDAVHRLAFPARLAPAVAELILSTAGASREEAPERERPGDRARLAAATLPGASRGKRPVAPARTIGRPRGSRREAQR